MNGFTAGYLYKEASPRELFESLKKALSSQQLDQLKRAQSLYKQDTTGESVRWLTGLAGKTKPEQTTALTSNPQHVPRILNTMDAAPAKKAPYKGFKNRAAYGLSGSKLIKGLGEAFKANPDTIKQTYNLRKK